MFVRMLDTNQRTALLRAGALLAEVDGAQPDEEREVLDALNVEAGLPEVPDPPSDLEELLAEVEEAFGDDPTARNVLLLELAGVAVIDGEMSSEEVSVIEEVSSRLGGGEELVNQAFRLAHSARDLVHEGRAFIASGD
jgi:tellurite resistance protein